jgi:hypothetical protein
LKRCKCELLLAFRKRTDFLGHFLLDAYKFGNANFQRRGTNSTAVLSTPPCS